MQKTWKSDRCYYCKRVYSKCKSLFQTPYKPLIQTKDHILPKVKGGENNVENYISCCNDCNLLKGSRTPKQFAKYLKTMPNKYFHPMKYMFDYMIFNSWKLHNKKQKLFIK